MAEDKTIKGLGAPPKTHDGSAFRIAIVHARWNDEVIKALVQGAVDKLKALGVKDENIVIKTVPGSYELPFACKKWVPPCQRAAEEEERGKEDGTWVESGLTECRH